MRLRPGYSDRTIDAGSGADTVRTEARHFAAGPDWRARFGHKGTALLACAMITAGRTFGADASVSLRPGEVLVFEQYQYMKSSSQYRVRVSAAGHVTYHGIANVRTSGVHEFQVSGEVVRDALQRISAYRDSWRLPESSLARPAGFQAKSRISIQDGDQVWSFTFHAVTHTPKYEELKSLIESSFPTHELRCPYYSGSSDPRVPSKLPGQSVEVCAAMGDVAPASRATSYQPRGN